MLNNPTTNKPTFHNPTGFNGYLIGLVEYFAIKFDSIIQQFAIRYLMSWDEGCRIIERSLYFISDKSLSLNPIFSFTHSEILLTSIFFDIRKTYPFFFNHFMKTSHVLCLCGLLLPTVFAILVSFSAQWYRNLK